MTFSSCKIEKNLRMDVLSIKHELDNISMREDYTRYVKTERKLRTTEDRYEKVREANNALKKVFSSVCEYGLSFALFIGVLLYRTSPVIVFDEKFNMAPFDNIIGFPTGVNNAISVPFWTFINRYFFRTFAGYFSQ